MRDSLLLKWFIPHVSAILNMAEEAFMTRNATYVKMGPKTVMKTSHNMAMVTHQTPTYMLKRERRILPRCLPRHNKAQFRPSMRMG